MQDLKAMFAQYDALRAELEREKERMRAEYDRDRDECVQSVMTIEGLSFSAAVEKVEGFCIPFPSRAEEDRIWREMSTVRDRITHAMYKDPVARRIHTWEPGLGSVNPFDEEESV